MTKTIIPFIKFSIIYSLLTSVLIFSQDQCPPAFISGVPLDQSVALAWEKPDTLSGYGVEVYSQCFTTCSSEGMTIEHMGQDSSGGWFRDNDGLAIDCDTDMYACSDAANEAWVEEQFGAVAAWSDTTAPGNSRMSTTLIDLSAYSDATLFFDEYIDYSSFANDSNFVEVSTDGVTWTTIHYSNPLTLGDGYFSNMIDLSTYAGQSIYIGFRYYDPIGYGCNWYVDNIRVFGGDGSGYSDPCETLIGYRVYQDGNMIAFVEDNQYTATGLTNGVDYCFKVSANYSSGESEFAYESCYAPIDPFILSQSSFSDTLDPISHEYSKFEFTLINLDTTAHHFAFESDGMVNATTENTLLSNTFENQETSTNFFDAQGYWSWGTPETANGEWLEYPSNTGGFFFFNDAEYYYTGTNYGYVPTDITLQSQALPYNGDGPVFFMADIFFVQPFGDCSTGDQYAESGSIVVSTDNGATWTVVDSTISTKLEWDGYLAVDWADANWHTMTYDITPYISPGIFTVGIRYTDCGGNFAYGMGVDNVKIIQGDNSSWLTMERSAGQIAPKDTMTMSLTMMPREDQNQIITSQLYVGPNASFDIDISMITNPNALGIDDNNVLNEFSLEQNYPNPFNPVTNISYNLPKDEGVRIIISDIMGKTIKTLVNNDQTSGQKTIKWNATNDQGNLVSAGLYFLTIEAGSFTDTNKMILLK